MYNAPERPKLDDLRRHIRDLKSWIQNVDQSGLDHLVGQVKELATNGAHLVYGRISAEGPLNQPGAKAGINSNQVHGNTQAEVLKSAAARLGKVGSGAFAVSIRHGAAKMTSMALDQEAKQAPPSQETPAGKKLDQLLRNNPQRNQQSQRIRPG
jgi:hypothetical protein